MGANHIEIGLNGLIAMLSLLDEAFVVLLNAFANLCLESRTEEIHLYCTEAPHLWWGRKWKHQPSHTYK